MSAKVRMTAAQASMFKKKRARKPKGQAPTPKLPRKPRTKKQRANLPENQVIKTCLDFLAVKGWIVRRQHVGRYVPLSQHMAALNSKGKMKAGVITMGQKGMPDFHAERVLLLGGKRVNARVAAPYCQIAMFEFKAPGEKPEAHQLEEIGKLNDVGIPAAWFDSFEKFEEYYKRMAFDAMASA
jgi:hypothetical protein